MPAAVDRVLATVHHGLMDPSEAREAAKDAAKDATGAAKDATQAATGKLRELGSFIRDQRKGAQLSLRKLASMAGVSNPYLSQIERGLRKPSAEILQAIAKALRISAETLYVKAGILDERGEDLASRIRADDSLTEGQKRALLEVYLSFRQGAVAEAGGAKEDTEAAALALLQRTATAEADDAGDDPSAAGAAT